MIYPIPQISNGTTPLLGFERELWLIFIPAGLLTIAWMQPKLAIFCCIFSGIATYYILQVGNYPFADLTSIACSAGCILMPYWTEGWRRNAIIKDFKDYINVIRKIWRLKNES